MTYADPRCIRDNQVKVLLNDDEMEFIEAAAERLGKQKATIVREYMLLGLRAWADGVDLSKHRNGVDFSGFPLGADDSEKA